MLSAVIIDDEIDAIRSIETIISDYCPNVRVAGTAQSAAEGIKNIRDKNPDIVFLDVEMPHGDGFKMLEGIEEINFDVVFITAYNHYAVKAFKVNAVDYILKPIDIDEFINAVVKVEERRNNNVPSGRNKYDKVLGALRSELKSKLELPTMEGKEYIDVDEIIRIEADGSYSAFHIDNDKIILVSKTLKEFKSLVNSYNFFRPHNSHIINIDKVKKFSKSEGGKIVMTDNSEVPLSRNNRELFREKMKEIII